MENLSTPATDQKALFVKMVISNWELQNSRLNKLIEKLSDEQWNADIAPGKNSGFYLLGHLTAVSDGMLPLLGFGEKLYPELAAIFLTSPDKSALEKPSLTDLKKYWETVNIKLTDHFSNLPAEHWFAKHNSISDEDFAREPHRNKLNIVINRTIHQGYHIGQLVLL